MRPVGSPAGTGKFRRERSAGKLLHYDQQFVDGGLAPAGTDGALYTAVCVVAQQLQGHGVQRRANRGNLCKHIDTVTILLDHPGDATDLSFHPVQPLEQFRLVGAVRNMSFLGFSAFHSRPLRLLCASQPDWPLPGRKSLSLPIFPATLARLSRRATLSAHSSRCARIRRRSCHRLSVPSIPLHLLPLKKIWRLGG